MTSAAGPAGPPSRFAQLAGLLSGAPPPLAADFALAALREMAAAYAREATLAEGDRRALARNPDLPQWARDVAAYAEQLNGIADRLSPRAQVGVELDPAGQAVLWLAGGPVVVAGPRIVEPGELEEAILARFCADHPCDALLAMHRPLAQRPVPPPRPAPPVSVSWVFAAAAGPLCVGDNGLELPFADSRELVQKRRLCSALVRELNALAQALREHGAAPSLAGLRVQAVAGDEVARVTFGDRHGELRLALPVLAVAPELVELARPWLAERVQGRTARLRLQGADRYLEALRP